MSKEEAAAVRKRARKRREQQTSEAIGARVLEQQTARRTSFEQQAAVLVAQAEALNERAAEATGSGASRQPRRAIEQARHELEDRRLRLLERDEDFVRSALLRREKLSGIMAADATTDGDELLWFVAEELKLLPVLEDLTPPATRVNKDGKVVKCRTMYSPLVLNLLALLSRSAGASSNPEIQAVLLTDERWMSLLGFNAAEVQNGSTRRSECLTGKTREHAGGRFVDAGPMGPMRARLQGPRGALSFQTLSEHESQLEPEAVADAFNAVIRALAQRGYFPACVRIAVDSTGEEVVPSFAGAGVVSKDVKVQSKARRPRKVKVRVRGFKLWYVMDVHTGLPVAMFQDTIETGETVPAQGIIEQAESNLQGYSRIDSCALDRGFLDGDLLWWLHQRKGINWVCPSKEGMNVTSEARGRVNEAIAALRAHDEVELQTAQRAARLGLSHNGVGFYEREVKDNRETLLVAQVDTLTDTAFYGEGGSTSSRQHSKHFRPTPLFATVVLRWPDRSPLDIKDAGEYDPYNKGPVVLLSPLQEGALTRYDRYDERSLIENRLNRDCKQHFGLGRSLARTPDAMWSATLFSTLALTLYRALEIHRENAREDSDRACEPLGILRYRRQLASNNHNRVIVVVGEHYGVLSLREYSQLLGVEFL